MGEWGRGHVGYVSSGRRERRQSECMSCEAEPWPGGWEVTRRPWWHASEWWLAMITTNDYDDDDVGHREAR